MLHFDREIQDSSMNRSTIPLFSLFAKTLTSYKDKQKKTYHFCSENETCKTKKEKNMHSVLLAVLKVSGLSNAENGLIIWGTRSSKSCSFAALRLCSHESSQKKTKKKTGICIFAYQISKMFPMLCFWLRCSKVLPSAL